MESIQEDDRTKGQEPVTLDEVVCLILHEYPFTTMNHFTASFKDGGLSEPQVESLYYEAIERSNRHLAIIASFHGCTISDSKSSSGTNTVKRNELPFGVTNPKTFVFGDPEEYEKMNEDQRTQLTEDMMLNHQNWVGSDKNLAVR